MLEVVRRPRRARRRVRRRARRRLPLARVRRQPPHPAERVDDDRPPTRRSRTLPAGRRAVLYAVRRRGEATAEQVAEQLDMTVSGARQHLAALGEGRARRVERAPVARRPPGPAHARVHRDRAPPTRYFPKAYGELTNELLGYVADTDRELLDQLFAKRREARIEGDAHAPGAEAHASRRRSPSSPASSTRTATSRVGNRWSRACSASSSTTARSGRWPSATARRAPASSSSSAPCWPAPTVERVQHMVAGARRCAYEVRGPRER